MCDKGMGFSVAKIFVFILQKKRAWKSWFAVSVVLGKRGGEIKRSPFKVVEMLEIQRSQSCVGESAHCYASVVDKNINVKEEKNQTQNKNPAGVLMSYSQEGILAGDEA